MMKYDVIVVGGGPAGLMAAGQAAESGARVLLLEKMHAPARKLLITGKGRCNITNVAPLQEFLNHFGKNSRFLRTAFHSFFTSELLDFLNKLGIQTVTERGGRVFPLSNRANDIVDALINWVKKCGVIIKHNSSVKKLLVKNGKIFGVEVLSKHKEKHSADKHNNIIEYFSENVIIAVGGASYPATGSSGDGYTLAGSVGHSIIQVRPALVPLETAGNTASRLQGLSLRNVSAKIIVDDKTIAKDNGEMIFTHFGVSGPIILSLSKFAVDALNSGKKVFLSIDLKPALDENKLDTRLLRDMTANGKQQFKTLLKQLLPNKIIPVCMDQIKVEPEKLSNQINAQDRKKLRIWLKNFRLEIINHRPLSEAIVTAGGVNIKEVNPKTMESRLIKGLYFAGEVLDLDADTGGYNLQNAFSTGWLAGKSVF